MPPSEYREFLEENLPTENSQEQTNKDQEHTEPHITKDIIDSLDDKTDRIFHLRSSIASLYPAISEYLPRDEKGEKIYLDRILDKIDAGADLDSVVDLSKINAPTETKKLFYKAKATVIFNLALEKQRELKALGGDFIGQDFKNQEQESIGKYYKYRFGEFVDIGTKINPLQDDIRTAEDCKIEISNEASEGTEQEVVIEMIRIENEKIKKATKQIRKLTNTPEGFIYTHGKTLKYMKECLDNHGRIIETPYIKSKMKTIEDSLKKSKPVFIHGELGSGKTELAKHVARKMMIKQWEKENPMPENQDDLKIWEIKRIQKTQEDPIVISGHKTIESEVMTGAITIKRGKLLIPEERLRIIEQKWQELKDKGLALEEDKNIFIQAYLDFLESPLEVKVELGPLMKAMKEGKPVIIDEMNAIPHPTLIILNDLLTRRTGEMVTPQVPGAEPVQIKEGFAVIATGNYKPEDGKMYAGRQAVDSALLSRYNLVSYDYLPNNKQIEPEGLSKEESREWRQQNELMAILITKMVDKNLSLTGPENVFRQVEKLSFVARNIQNVFSGKNIGEAWYGKGSSGSKISPESLLKENVLSIRHLIPIIEQWKWEGYSKPLDYYLFTKYISRSGARPQEKAYLYGVLQTMGDFFNVDDGWPEADDLNALAEMDESTLSPRLNEAVETSQIKTYSAFEVLEKIFGERPDRDTKTIPTGIFQAPIEKEAELGDIIERKRKIMDMVRGLGTLKRNTN